MTLRDRFYTPATAKAILSWRILLGLGVGVVVGVVGAPIWLAVVAGVATYAVSVALAMPRGGGGPRIDAFALGEPWRHYVHNARLAAGRMRAAVDATPAGPLRKRLTAIADQIDSGLAETWEIARRGDAIDDVVRGLDPTTLRSKLDHAQRRAAADPSPAHDAAVTSIQAQLDSAERLQHQSAETASKLGLAQTRFDELVARAAEVRIGSVDTDEYERDIDDLVVQLRSLHMAVEETRET